MSCSLGGCNLVDLSGSTFVILSGASLRAQSKDLGGGYPCASRYALLNGMLAARRCSGAHRESCDRRYTAGKYIGTSQRGPSTTLVPRYAQDDKETSDKQLRGISPTTHNPHRNLANSSRPTRFVSGSSFSVSFIARPCERTRRASSVRPICEYTRPNSM